MTRRLNSLSTTGTNFGVAYYKIYACFEQQAAFVVQKFRNLEAGGDHFFTKHPKGISLANFTRFEPLRVQIRSSVFFSRRPDE